MQCMRNKQTDLESIKPIWYLWLDSWGPCVSCTFKIWVVKWVSEWVIDCHLFWTRSHSCQVPKGVPTGSYSMLAMVCWHCKEIRNVRVHCSGGVLWIFERPVFDVFFTRWLNQMAGMRWSRAWEWETWVRGCTLMSKHDKIHISPHLFSPNSVFWIVLHPPYCLNLILCAPHFTFDFSPSIWTLTIFI